MAKLLLTLDFRAKIILVMLPITLVVFVALGYYIYTNQANTYEADGIARSKEYVHTYADEISKELGTHVDIATEIASTFSAYQGIEANSRRSFYQRYLEVVMKRNKRTAAAWVDFDKNALDGRDDQFKNVGIFPASGRFFMQTYREGEKFFFQKEDPATPVETFVTEDWLDWPRKQKKSIIVEPYMWTYTNDSSNMNLMTAICVPVLNQNEEVVGVAGIDLMFQHIVDFVSKIKPFGSGYATLMSENEKYLAHPNPELIEKGIADNPIFPPDAVKEITAKMPAKTEFYVDFHNQVTDKRTFIFFAPVPVPKTDSKFMTAVVVPYDAMIAHAKASVDNIFVAFGLAIIIITVLIVSVVSGLTAPLRKLFRFVTEYLVRISKGDIPQPIDESKYSGDFLTVIDSLNSAGKSISALTHTTQNLLEQALNGDLHARADANLFQGDYKKLMNGVNELVNAFAEPLAIATMFVKGVAAGDSNVQRFTKQYKGDFAELANAVNTTIDTLNLIVGEIMQIAEQARTGNLSQRADVSKVQGGWRDILGSLNTIVASADDIIKDSNIVLGTMATGDLTPRITNTYLGNFKSMQDSINNLGDSLTDLISQLQRAVYTTASASAEISATAESLASATQEQSSQTDEVAGAMEDMARTVADNARSVTRTADVAKRSGEIAGTGGKVVEQTVAKMKEIADVVKVSAASMVKLGQSSKRIGEIISVIDDIADQTNLLSLNAAIEAARAGEQGRGFAVVADSVGKLAVSTAGATKEIADMIKGIQVDTEAAVSAMEKGTEEVQSGIELADNAGHSIQDILSGINELLEMINSIAEASEKQSVSSEQISHNVSSISKVTADSARNIEDVANTANDLAKMTETLTSLISQFKIDGVAL